MKNIVFYLLITLPLIVASCEKQRQPTRTDWEQGTVALSQAYSPSCTEAYLLVQTEGVKLPTTVELLRNDSLVRQLTLDRPDTLVVDTALWPSTTYRFQARLRYKDNLFAQSQEITQTTLDTTSHDFTWQTWQFGGGAGSSDFYDVAIINENDIWAVGEIHTPDTDKWNADSTEWLTAYNAAHWNGTTWKSEYVSQRQGGINKIWGTSSNNLFFV